MVDQCPICYDDLKDNVITTPCNHKYHLDCVYNWIKDNPSCPYCRLDIMDNKYFRKLINCKKYYDYIRDLIITNIIKDKIPNNFIKFKDCGFENFFYDDYYYSTKVTRINGQEIHWDWHTYQRNDYTHYTIYAKIIIFKHCYSECLELYNKFTKFLLSKNINSIINNTNILIY